MASEAQPSGMIGPLAGTQLHWELRGAEIVVTPSDQDRFLIQVGRAVEILRQQSRGQSFANQFNLLMKKVAAWLAEHEGRWQRAFLTAGQSVLRLVVIRRLARFEPDLTDSLSDLSVAVANDPDFDLIKFDARALPAASDESIQSFLDPTFTIEFNGHGTGAHRAGQS